MATHRHHSEGAKRFRAKVNNYGFRGAFWQAGDIVEVSPEEAQVIPHHFEEMKKADDGSQDQDMREKIADAEKMDHIRDQKARDTYDEVRPFPAGGPALPIDKSPEDKSKEAAERKAEEVENDKRREEEKKSSRRKVSTSVEETSARHSKSEK